MFLSKLFLDHSGSFDMHIKKKKKILFFDVSAKNPVFTVGGGGGYKAFFFMPSLIITWQSRILNGEPASHSKTNALNKTLSIKV